MKLEDGMLLYHGSYAPIQKIDLDRCASGKDFGRGFYLTDDYSQAKAFISNSLKKAKNLRIIPENQQTGYVTTFRYTEPKNDIGIYAFDSANVKWLWFVSMNRRSEMAEIFRADLDQKLLTAEIVIGKIANDKTNPAIMAYLNGLYGDVRSETAIQFVINQLLPDRLNSQYCFLSKRAVACLEGVKVDRYG